MSDKGDNGRVEYNQKLITELRQSVEKGFNRVNDKLDDMKERQQQQVNSFYSHCEQKREYIRRDINEGEDKDDLLDKRISKLEKRTYLIFIIGIGLGSIFGYALETIISGVLGG